MLVSYKEFFKLVLNKKIKLTSEENAEIYCSWKVDGQEFYVYGKYNENLDAELLKVWEEMTKYWKGDMGPAYIFVKDIEHLFIKEKK